MTAVTLLIGSVTYLILLAVFLALATRPLAGGADA